MTKADSRPELDDLSIATFLLDILASFWHSPAQVTGAAVSNRPGSGEA